LTWFAFGFILIAKIGTSVKVSHAVGENEIDKVNVFATNGLMLQVFFGVVFSILVLLFKEQFLGIFNIQSAQIVEYALMYIPIIGGFIFIQFINNGFIAINEGLGQTRINLKILAIGFVFNMIMDPILILGFKLGIQGAAIATVTAQFFTLTIFYFVYKKHNPKLKIFHFSNFNLSAIKKILLVGLPAGVQSIFFTAISIYIAREIYLYGGNVVAAQRVGVQVEQLTWMISGGFQTAITIFVGQNFGAKQYARIKRGVWSISLVLIPYALIITAILVIIPESLMRIFIDDPITVNYGINYLKIISISQVFMIIEGIGTGFFNGIAKSFIPSITSIIGNSLRVPLVIILTKTLAEEGIWWSLNISSIVKALVILLVFIFLVNKIEELKSHRLVLRKKRGSYV
jgi:putative MATE family efflux protein